ncbi:uncharacterized protein LOC134663846 [Cydia fagiglandana]|uniref:uncharacterized protein LOC134663846 n=1 Tax=Cydia fagiglandana TaxID=1458189 RepID=UPI002FEE40E9
MMSDVDEIIDYIKSLKKGFDKDLFQSKIDELAHAVDTVGLEYEDFHTLFKVWLNLTIPITKWVSIGVCLVPQNCVTEQTVDYALRWLLANAQDQTNFSRIAFLLDWLTAAMDCESVDIAALDCGYEVFFSFLTSEVLAAHVLKLVYTLTKPTDVTRTRVLELFDCAKKRESKKSMCRQLQVLLGLFKSYKPECVPEDIPAVPVHTTFKSNITLLTRFKKWQEQRNEEGTQSLHLRWTNPMLGGNGKKGESLVPNIEFINIGSQQYQDKEPQKNYLDFTDPVSLLQYSVHRSVSRPARLRALLRNNTGVMLLALSDARTQAALHHDLHYMLTGCKYSFSTACTAQCRARRDYGHSCATTQESCYWRSYSVHRSVSRPARLRALLRNNTGVMLLALSDARTQAALHHDLHYMLTGCKYSFSTACTAQCRARRDYGHSCATTQESCYWRSYSVHRSVSRSARLRALLRNNTGVMLLALSDARTQAALHHDLHYMLTGCKYSFSTACIAQCRARRDYGHSCATTQESCYWRSVTHARRPRSTMTCTSCSLAYSVHRSVSRPARLRALLRNNTGVMLLALSDARTQAALHHDLHYMLTGLLLQYSVHRSVSRPARLRALLRNNTGVMLLALSDARTQAALHHDLHYMLTGCFLDASPHSELEKRDALHCVAVLQRTLCQPIRAASAFLAHLLPLWDETHYFNEILELLEWVEADPELLPRVLEPVARAQLHAPPARRAAVLRALHTLYTNLVRTVLLLLLELLEWVEADPELLPRVLEPVARAQLHAPPARRAAVLRALHTLYTNLVRTVLLLLLELLEWVEADPELLPRVLEPVARAQLHAPPARRAAVLRALHTLYTNLVRTVLLLLLELLEWVEADPELLPRVLEPVARAQLHAPPARRAAVLRALHTLYTNLVRTVLLLLLELLEWVEADPELLPRVLEPVARAQLHAPPARRAAVLRALHTLYTNLVRTVLLLLLELLEWVEADPELLPRVLEPVARAQLHAPPARRAAVLRALHTLYTNLVRTVLLLLLELLEWVEADPELLPRVLEPVARAQLHAPPARRAAVLRALHTLYTNLVYSSTRRRQHFVCSAVPRDIYKDALSYVASTISTMCGKALQVDPEDHLALHSCVSGALRAARAQLAHGAPALPAPPPPPALALPLLAVSADLLDKVAALILTYKEIMFAMQSNKENRRDQSYIEQKRTLKGYTSDIVRCLVDETSFSGGQSGLVFQRLHPQVVRKLTEYIPESDSALSIRNHLAFAPYTYIQISDSGFADNELWFDAVIKKEFTHLSTLLNMLGWGRKMVD